MKTKETKEKERQKKKEKYINKTTFIDKCLSFLLLH